MVKRTGFAIAVLGSLATMTMLPAGFARAADKPMVVATFSVLADIWLRTWPGTMSSSPPLWAATGTRNFMNRRSRIVERWPELGLCS